jgi:hypothetical protein
MPDFETVLRSELRAAADEYEPAENLSMRVARTTRRRRRTRQLRATSALSVLLIASLVVTLAIATRGPSKASPTATSTTTPTTSTTSDLTASSVGFHRFYALVNEGLQRPYSARFRTGGPSSWDFTIATTGSPGGKPAVANLAYSVSKDGLSFRFIQRSSRTSFECLRHGTASWLCEGPPKLLGNGGVITELGFNVDAALAGRLPGYSGGEPVSQDAAPKNSRLQQGTVDGFAVLCLQVPARAGYTPTSWCINSEGIFVHVEAFGAPASFLTEIDMVSFSSATPPAGSFALPARPSPWHNFLKCSICNIVEFM